MRGAIIATFLIVPLGLFGGCSDAPSASPSVATDDAGGGVEAGTVVDGGDAGSKTPADSGPFDAGPCLCDDNDPNTVGFCPKSSSCAYLAVGETSRTLLSGGGGGVSAAQVCPAPSILVGVSASVSGAGASARLLRVNAVCGFPRATTSTYPHVVDFPDKSTPSGEVMNGTTKVCPGAVRGFEGRGGTAVDKFVARCGGVALVSPAVNELTLSVSASPDTFEFGGGGGNPWAPTDCPAGSIAIGLQTRESVDVLSAIGLICGAPTFQYE